MTWAQRLTLDLAPPPRLVQDAEGLDGERILVHYDEEGRYFRVTATTPNDRMWVWVAPDKLADACRKALEAFREGGYGAPCVAFKRLLQHVTVVDFAWEAMTRGAPGRGELN